MNVILSEVATGVLLFGWSMWRLTRKPEPDWNPLPAKQPTALERLAYPLLRKFQSPDSDKWVATYEAKYPEAK